jgi:predicted ATPase
MARKGTGASETEDIYTRARTLCHQLGEMSQLFPVLWGLWRCYFARGACVTAQEVSQQMLTLAEQLNDLTMLRIAHAALGQILFFMGDFSLACRHLEQGVALFDEEQSHEILVQYGFNPHLQRLVFLSRTLWSLGHPDQSLRYCQEARTLSQALDHPPSMALSLWYAAALYQHRRETQTADVLAEALMMLSTEHSFAQWLAMGTFLRGWVLAEQGQLETGLVQMHQGLSDVMDAGGRAARPHFLTLLAEAYGKNSQIDKGLSLLADALEGREASGRRDLETEVYRLQGVLLLQQHTPDISQAEACFHQALDIARKQ